MRLRIVGSRSVLPLPLLLALIALTPACGGGAGGAGPDGAGQGLELMNFLQAGQDNVPINRVLEFRFSEPVDPATITTASVQIREGPQYGLTVAGSFVVEGAVVKFEPVLPSLCDKSDAGFKPGTDYRINLMGDPEQFCVRNTQGQPLTQTSTFTFRTRPEADPEYLEDQVPGVQPSVISQSPGKSEAGVTVADGNQVVIGFSENVDPCSVNDQTVSLWMYEMGDMQMQSSIPAGETNEGNLTGFDPWYDSLPDDPYSWGGNASPRIPPQRIPSDLILEQGFDATQLRIVPGFGRFPENALVVISLTFGIVDFGGQPLAPLTYSFTTENLDEQDGTMTVEFDHSAEPWPTSKRTADVDTARSPNLAQGWMLFAGDGDNGASTSVPAWPQLTPFFCGPMPNDGNLDHFDPEQDVTLNTGATPIPGDCTNETDGSNAAVYEFATFRIRDGVTVRVVGVNPIIILVQGEILIEANGILRARADNIGGSPRGVGQTGYSWTSYASAVRYGGVGVAGAGDGGDAAKFNTEEYGGDGFSAYGSADGYDVKAGEGAGEGGSIHDTVYPNSPGTSQGGGGGGHAVEGGTSTNVLGTGHTDKDGTRGGGGGTYGDEKLQTPSAGAGGGAGGNEEWAANYAGVYSTGGGGGGAGGGFVDLTSQTGISIHGMIDAAGNRGGSGGSSNYYAGPGGGGGGAGGGIRLITSGKITVGPTTLITAAGGAGGNSPNGNSGSSGPQNHGAPGGNGRIVLEDDDSVIDGMVAATIIPGETEEGFYRGKFDSTRFTGGGLIGEATSDPLLVGPLTPVAFEAPLATDFICAIPADAARGTSGTSIIIEARGLPMEPDGTPDDSAPDVWYTIGFFSYSGTPSQPTWNPGTNPPDAAPGENNVGAGIHNLDGSAFLEIRLRFYLPETLGPTDPGPWMDQLNLRFKHNQ